MSLSKDYVSDSDSEEEVFTAPRHFHKFSPAKLPKKEIWLIKAPVGFNFSQLKALPVSFNPVEESEPVEQGGKTYVVQEDLTDLVSEGAKYKVIGKGIREIKRFYNIREKVQIPGISYDKVVKPRKDIRKTTGLQKQHFATGYDRADGDEASDVDEEFSVKRVKHDKKEKKEKKDKKDKRDKSKKEKKSKN